MTSDNKKKQDQEISEANKKLDYIIKESIVKKKMLQKVLAKLNKSNKGIDNKTS